MNHTIKAAAATAAIALLSACAQTTDSNTATTSDTSKSEILTVTVAPQQADCVGIAPRKCLVVDGQLFYSDIQGFEFEPGFEYQLQIEKSLAFGGGPVPADASRYQYRLIKQISRSAK
ncbi:DUF4377 domain-containing protein [Ferrimonas senticii]|uniref:DUF4377 domain-containing protein n=1 Tax=Ferrimonas senticii TaxID=394566 RepID=UPI000405B6E7|nr:DUF4377 domain-containing protein [Ferrimonas senticii]